MSDQSREEKLAILREGLARCEREAADLRAAIRDLEGAAKVLSDAEIRALLWQRPEDISEEIVLVIHELLERRAADTNESRELSFARYILAQQIDVTGEIRALAEDTVARAKARKRTS